MQGALSAAGLVAVAVVVVGCGGASGGGQASARTDAPGTTRSTTPDAAHAAFISQVEAVCSTLTGRVDELTPTMQKAAAAQDDDALADVYLERNSAGLLAISDLRMLHPPAADADAYEQYVTAIEQRETFIASFIPALHDHDDRLLQSWYQAAAAAHAKASQAADRLGAAQCAQPSEVSPA
jgi:hypothetical protein